VVDHLRPAWSTAVRMRVLVESASHCACCRCVTLCVVSSDRSRSCYKGDELRKYRRCYIAWVSDPDTSGLCVLVHTRYCEGLLGRSLRFNPNSRSMLMHCLYASPSSKQKSTCVNPGFSFTHARYTLNMWSQSGICFPSTTAKTRN